MHNRAVPPQTDLFSYCRALPCLVGILLSHRLFLAASFLGLLLFPPFLKLDLRYMQSWYDDQT
jgi:hypothetical protein